MLGTRSVRLFVALAAITALAAGCGDDDDDDAADTTTTTEAEEETTSTTAEEGEDGVNPEFADYCAAVAEVDATAAPPTEEQIEAIRAAAPEEISAEIEIVADAFVEAIAAGDVEAAFEAPGVEEAFGPIDEFEAENCGEGFEEAEVDRSAINPEFQEYCEASIELFEQPDLPTAEQLEELGALAPEEIADEAAIVVPAFIAAIEAGDIESAFSDPEVGSNLEAIEAFDAENCGIPDEG